MARRSQYQGATKAITGAVPQTIVWNPSDIPAAGLVGLHLQFAGGTDLADVERIRVKAAGTPLIDVGINPFRAFVQRLSKSNRTLALTDTRFTIPLNIPDASSPDMADVCQFPQDSACTVEIQLAGSAVAGSAILGWTISDVWREGVMHYPFLIGQAMGIVANSNDYRFQYQPKGKVLGFDVPVRGLGTMRYVAGDVEFFNLTGPCFGGTDNAPGAGFDLISEAQADNDGPIFAVATGAHRFLRLAAVDGPVGSTYVQLTTYDVATAANDWGGATEEVTTWSIAPQQGGG